MSLTTNMNRAVKRISRQYETVFVTETANYKTVVVPDQNLEIRINYIPMTVQATRGGTPDPELSQQLQAVI